jgi:hypothetical protein
LTALNINFTSKKEKEYSPDFVKRIQESRQQVREGKVIKIKKTCGVGLSEKADLSYRKNSGIFLLNVRSNL